MCANTSHCLNGGATHTTLTPDPSPITVPSQFPSTDRMNLRLAWIRTCAWLSRETEEFSGFEIIQTGVRPCARYLEAIRHFPNPKISWTPGAVSAPSIRSRTPLLQPSACRSSETYSYQTRDLNGLPNSTNSFKNTRFSSSTKSIRGLKSWTGPSILGWSRIGAKMALTSDTSVSTVPAHHQNHSVAIGWRITLVGSRFISVAESRYAPIEGEALVVVDTLDKARHFTLGCSDLIVAVDHKPLLNTFGDRCLHDIPNSSPAKPERKVPAQQFPRHRHPRLTP
ncbi:hypothetical protein PoB_006761700 [Plakobranchus ocellatus]|uniref:Reverse transcriptase RNase H-like domain-containing protein n=1 Tax=Plakobranchus ocellatus TaxID=259542 RepID=A0AAV4DA80_9GAST|nr:hypothetical protein PoB_006761700 [Plakobranchus ocellatus]